MRLSTSTEEQAVEWNGGDGSGTRATFPALAGLTRAAAVLSRMYCVGQYPPIWYTDRLTTAMNACGS